MKELLKELLIEPFTERDWLGYIFSTLAWLVVILILALILWLSVWLIDSSFLPIKQKEGTITKKIYTPAHTYTTYIMVGKVMMPMESYVQANYEIEITIDGLTDNVSINRDSWECVPIGKKFCCEYTNGRLLQSLYVKSFCSKIYPVINEKN